MSDNEFLEKLLSEKKLKLKLLEEDIAAIEDQLYTKGKTKGGRCVGCIYDNDTCTNPNICNLIDGRYTGYVMKR